jgi:uncharacterized YccA/Bax inhibitor family protein
MRLHSSNPILTRVEKENSRGMSYASGETATFTGIATKTGILLAIIFAISAVIWSNFEAWADQLMVLFMVSSIVGFISALLAQFTKATAFFTVLYAVCQGVFLGTFTFIVQAYIEPKTLVFSAISITFIILGFLLVAYASGLFKVGFRFRKIVYTAMFSILIFYFINFILSLFGGGFIGTMSPGMMIGLTVLMVILASFNLLIDFDNCKKSVDAEIPKRYEWHLSLGLLISLVWLYVEVLRLLILIAGRTRD